MKLIIKFDEFTTIKEATKLFDKLTNSCISDIEMVVENGRNN